MSMQSYQVTVLLLVIIVVLMATYIIKLHEWIEKLKRGQREWMEAAHRNLQRNQKRGSHYSV